MASQPTPRGGLLRRLFLAAFDREEQGFPPMPAHAAMTPVNGHPPDTPMDAAALSVRPHLPKRLTVSTTDTSCLIPPGDKLLVFRALTGIDSVPTLTTLHHFARTAPNVGIYTRVVRAEQSAAQRYRFFSILINTCLSIQIVVAAALTALGAASGPHAAVTAFGAINTIMAGVLTYLKGSGLPDRLKQYQHEWRNIREYIEQREREMCLDGCGLDVQEEIQIIEHMYEGVKRKIEATKSSGDNRASQQSRNHRRSFLPMDQPPSSQPPPSQSRFSQPPPMQHQSAHYSSTQPTSSQYPPSQFFPAPAREVLRSSPVAVPEPSMSTEKL
ncbi:hypothetical protein EYZ11_007102 [Aspergillus tanneri]|nr:hypothetical protein EYZ11_007102 [Aspergillus tanneri]